MRAIVLGLAVVIARPPVRLTAQDSTRIIRIGQVVSGELTQRDYLRHADSTYAQEWTVAGVAGKTVTVELASEAFDAFLYVIGPGLPQALQDDDSGGRCNARLTLTFPQTAVYRIIVSTSGPRETGAYTLAVSPGAKPASLERCGRAQ